MANNKAWWISIAASALLVVGVFAATFGAGLRFYIVSSPSMGTTAPVGTLVAVRGQASYAVGEVVSYARSGKVYTHRIVDITQQGFITQGDINASPDAFPVAQSQIVGSVTFIGKNLGFLVEALPWLVLSWALVYGLTLLPRLDRGWRWHFRLIGWSLATSLVGLWFRPWVNMDMIGYVQQAGGVDMHLVNTGIFPVRVLGTVLVSGQDAVVTQTIGDAAGRYSVTPQVALNTWYFIVLMVLCLTPLLVSLVIPVEGGATTHATAVPSPATRRFAWATPRHLRWASVALTVTASVVVVAMVLQMSTHAALVATIKNSTNTAGAATFFTCKNAETSLGKSGTYLAWALSSTSRTETDLSGNSRTGGYVATPTTYSTSVGCPQDTPKAAVTFNGTSQCLYENANYQTSGYYPNTFSLEAWFLTGKASNGVIIGFGDSRTSAADNNWDRHIYLDKNGRIVFGVYPGAVKIVYTSKSYNDSHWHHVVATLSSAGESLYVDGTLAMTDPTVTTAEQKQGYWKVGCGNLTNWANAGSTTLDYNGPSYFTGQIQYAAVYNVALTATQVSEHYAAGA